MSSLCKAHLNLNATIASLFAGASLRLGNQIKGSLAIDTLHVETYNAEAGVIAATAADRLHQYVQEDTVSKMGTCCVVIITLAHGLTTWYVLTCSVSRREYLSVVTKDVTCSAKIQTVAFIIYIGRRSVDSSLKYTKSWRNFHCAKKNRKQKGKKFQNRRRSVPPRALN